MSISITDTMITAKDILQLKAHKVSLQESKNCIYNGSPFQVYKQMSSKKKGARFEGIVQESIAQT